MMSKDLIEKIQAAKKLLDEIQDLFGVPASEAEKLCRIDEHTNAEWLLGRCQVHAECMSRECAELLNELYAAKPIGDKIEFRDGRATSPSCMIPAPRL
jgi:hypothetical protein